jgi:hypothetical protein
MKMIALNLELHEITLFQVLKGGILHRRAMKEQVLILPFGPYETEASVCYQPLDRAIRAHRSPSAG